MEFFNKIISVFSTENKQVESPQLFAKVRFVDDIRRFSIPQDITFDKLVLLLWYTSSRFLFVNICD